MIKLFVKFIIFVGVVFVLGEVLMLIIVSQTRPQFTKADAIVVLGAAINTPALTNRTLEGLKLYQQHKADVMILSGGKISDSDISEAQFMEKVIKKNSKQKVNYILEEGSHNTYENLTNTLNKKPDIKSLVIVSDEFHLARGVAIARSLGVKDVYWSAPEPTYYNNKELLYYYGRELVALNNYLPMLIMSK